MEPDIRLVVPFVSAAICAWGAARKNRNPFLWGALGFFFPLTILIVACLSFVCPVCRKTLTNMQWSARACPDCGDIQSPEAAMERNNPRASYENEVNVSDMDRAKAVTEALETGDEVQKEWASNELRHLPESVAGQIAEKYKLDYEPKVMTMGETKRQDVRRQEEAAAKYRQASKNEARGRYNDALEAYQLIVKEYPETLAGSDSKQAYEALRKRMGTPESVTQAHRPSIVPIDENPDLQRTKAELRKLVYGDEGAMRRLLELERNKHPGTGEIELYRGVVDRLLSDRRR